MSIHEYDARHGRADGAIATPIPFFPMSRYLSYIATLRARKYRGRGRVLYVFFRLARVVYIKGLSCLLAENNRGKMRTSLFLFNVITLLVGQ